MSTQGATARRGGVLEVALVGALLLLANVGLWLYFASSRPAGGTSPEGLREVASKLASAGVKGEAAKYYAAWLERADVSDGQRAQVGLALAKLLKEDGQLEAALGWLYRVEQWAPGSEAAKEAAPEIVAVLDRLGLSQAAQTALTSRSRLEKPDQAPSDGAVVAKIDGQPLTTSDLEQAIEELPPPLGKQLEDPAKRKEFLPQFVARELLYRKAITRGLDRDPQVRRQLDALSRQVVISAMLEQELKEKVKPDESDLRNFFLAHADQFRGADGKPAVFEQVREQVGQAYLMSRVQSLSEELLAQAQAAREVQLFPEALERKPSTAGGTP